MLRNAAILVLFAVGSAACGEQEPTLDPGPDSLTLAQGTIDTGTAAPEVEAPAEVVLAGAENDAPTAPGETWETFPVAVRSGENLVLLASWAGISVEVLVELNGLDARDPLMPGQHLLLPVVDGGGPELLAQARQAHAERRLASYARGRGGLVAATEHRVRTGETAWGIARDQAGIPFWVLAAFNPEVDLDRLTIGAVVLLPVYGDTVADAEPDEPRLAPERDDGDETALKSHPESVDPGAQTPLTPW